MSHHHHHPSKRPTHTRSMAIIFGALAVLGAVIVIFLIVRHDDSQTTVAPASPSIAALLPPAGAVSDAEITHGDRSKKQLIFTFDGGGSATSSDQILAALAKHHVKGTFFLTGTFIEHNPDLVRRMVADGNEVFSHTYDHPHLTALSDEEIDAEFHKTEQALMKTAGVSPKPFFRPPYGDRDDHVIREAFKDGYESVYWTVDARDWQEPQGMTADQVENRIISDAAPGTIYLMHLGDTITGAILDRVFTELEAAGYRMVSLTQGL